MVTYKQWKTVNESFIGSTTLGLATPQSMGLVGQQVQQLPSEEQMLDEMRKKMSYMKDNLKKKMKKKMDGDVDIDGEVVPPAAKKDADPDADIKAAADSTDGDEVSSDDTGEIDGKVDDDAEKKCMKKKMKKEADESEAFWNSLQTMMAPQDGKNWDGWSPVDDLPVTTDSAPAEPGPGEVGFAPSQRIAG
jgi:hypothetical protein